VQILQFAHSFASAPRQVKQLLFDEVSRDTKVYEACDSYAQEYGLRNVDNMLDHLVNDTFRALIIIDEATDELYKVVKNFRFPGEVIEVETYQGAGGDHIYRFTPLFKDVSDVKESIEEREQSLILLWCRREKMDSRKPSWVKIGGIKSASMRA
jgi:DNA repair ATPase RecN